MVKVGQVIPDFEVDAYVEDAIKKIKLSEYRGKWLILAFYPADFTFICPTELVELANLYDKFKEVGAEVISVSTDTVYVHKAWHDTSKSVAKIRYPMVSDPTAKLCREFGTYMEEVGLSLRGTFIIDPDGILKTIDVHDNSIGRNAKEIMRKLQAAQYVREHGGEVCPASWEPGKETLKPSLSLVGKI
jgi:peroxiredoxin (alkyl hydroperoxide reductase subunit C)